MDIVFDKLNELRAKGIAAMLVTVVAKTGEGPLEPGKKMVVGENGDAFGTVGGGAIERFARDKCQTLIATRTSMMERYLLKEGKVLPEHETMPMACGGTATLFLRLCRGERIRLHLRRRPRRPGARQRPEDAPVPRHGDR